MVNRIICFLAVVCFFGALFGQSVVFAKTYRWTDADGSVHFSDDPLDMPESDQGQESVTKQNIGTNLPKSSQDAHRQVAREKQERFKRVPSLAMNPACEQEVTTVGEVCIKRLLSTLLARLSPNCRQQFELQSKIDHDCAKEFEGMSTQNESLLSQQAMMDCFEQNLSRKCKKDWKQMIKQTEEAFGSQIRTRRK